MQKEVALEILQSINIAGHKIEVVFKDKLESDGQTCMGLAFVAHDRIELASTIDGLPVSDDQLSCAYLHEILHIISSLYGIGLSEKKIERLELGLYQCLHDNSLHF